MAYAYDINILPVAQNLLGGMLDFAVNGLQYNISEFYQCFLDSVYCKRVERADSSTVMGRSSIELCYGITDCEHMDKSSMDEFLLLASTRRSREFWTGWAISYLQWKTGLSFKEIDDISTINNICSMYDIYHEMDILHFVDRMKEIYKEKNPNTRLKQMRINAGLSQKNLAEMTLIPVKTIQQYEQRQKNINNASVDYVVRLSKTLNCNVESLLEVF